MKSNFVLLRKRLWSPKHLHAKSSCLEGVADAEGLTQVAFGVQKTLRIGKAL